MAGWKNCGIEVPDGLLVIDKPQGPTSHDVVDRIRRVLGERQIGHTGTLDPAASGVLPLVVGRATRLARFLNADDKTYEVEIRLGVATDTGDGEGMPVGVPHHGSWPSGEDVDRALDAFRGRFLQQPPAFSAKKIGGIRSYVLARQSRPTLPTLPAPVEVTAHAIELVAARHDLIVLRVECSSGFYVRSLARDVGERLGTGAYLSALRRTRCGDFTISGALPLEFAMRTRDEALRALIPLSQMLPALTLVVLTDEGVRRALHGRDLSPSDTRDGAVGPGTPFVRLFDPNGGLLGVGEPARAPGFLHPLIVLR